MVPRFCLRCEGTFDDHQKLNYTCRCLEGHALCFPCSENLRYSEARKLFGFAHYLDVKKHHPDDVKEWDEHIQKRQREITDFENTVIEPNYFYFKEGDNNDRYLNMGKILDQHRGVKHRGCWISEEYDQTYLPEEVQNRWEDGAKIQSERGTIHRPHDIIYQIRTPINTVFELRSHGEALVFKTDLVQNEPFALKLPLCACIYSEVYFDFTPKTSFEYTYIDIRCSGSPLEAYLTTTNMVVPENNIKIYMGLLGPFDRRYFRYE